MERPINVFWNFLRNLKDLVVSIKIGSSKADAYGTVLEQLSENEFKVEDNLGNQGVCKLVNKSINQLNNNEMSIAGFILQSSTFVYISTVINKVMIDFNNNEYNWNIEHDSTANILVINRTVNG